MGRGNTLAGASEMQQPSFRIEADLLDDFDDWVDDSGHSSRSKAIRELIRETVKQRSVHETPLIPPMEERLAVAYRRLCMTANRDGVIKEDRAKRVCAGGPEQLSKNDVADLVLRPLQERGYLRRRTNLRGDTAWKLNGWERNEANEVNA